MQVVLLATGEQQKLNPLTERITPPMVPILDRPVMVWAVELLARQGFAEALVSLHRDASAVEQFFGKGRRWGLELQYVLQREAWGTAGALKWAEGLLGSPFIVMPADALIDVDLQRVIAFHREGGQSATVVVKDAAQGTPVYVSESGQVIGHNQGRQLAAVGIYVFEPHVLAYIPRRTPFDIQADLIPALWTVEQRVEACEIEGYWNPLESFAGYQAAQRDMLKSGRIPPEERRERRLPRHPEVQGTSIAEGIWVGRNQLIHPTARLRPPVFIGDNSRIDANVELGPDVIIGSNVIIDEGATVEESTIVDHTYVGRLVKVANRIVHQEIVIDLETGRQVAVVDDFLLAAVDPEQVGNRFQLLLDRVAAFLLLWITLPVLWLLALLTFVTTARVFKRETHYLSQKQGYQNGTRAVPLLRFYTRYPDGRYAGFGRWLERQELHRLPELWNVVRGDLALVGVKPLLPGEANSVTDGWQETRQQQPAGFTGLWYVQTDQTADIDEVLVADAYYAATRSWREDVRLFFRTPAGWWRRQHVRED